MAPRAVAVDRSEAVLAELPSWAVRACRAAVDPLEVVTVLEVSGVTRSAAARHGATDVAALGRRVFREVALRPAPATDRLPRPGGAQDLVRGAAFVVPGLLLLAAAKGLGLHMAPWTLPLSMVAGWSLTYVLSTAGALLEGRHRRPDAVLAVTALAGVAVAAAAAAAARAVAGGGESSAVTVAVVVAYLAAVAVLLSRHRLGVVAAALGPAVVAAAVAVADPVEVARHAVAGTCLAAAAATVGLAGWSLRPGRRGTERDRPGRLARVDAAVLAWCGTAGCGAALLTVAVAAAVGRGTLRWSVVLVPLAAALGVMEWQVRTLRHRCARAMAGAPDRSAFTGAFRRAYARSAGIHLATLGVVVAATCAWLGRAGHPVPATGAVAVVALGGSLFAGLVLIGRGRSATVVGAWALGLVTYLVAASLAAAPVRLAVPPWVSGRLPTAAHASLTAAAGHPVAVLAAAVGALVVLTASAAASRPFEHG